MYTKIIFIIAITFMAPNFALCRPQPQPQASSSSNSFVNKEPPEPRITDPATLPGKSPSQAGQDLTINIANNFGTPLAIFYRSNDGAPSPTNVDQNSATLTSTTVLTYPTHWAGSIVIGYNYDTANSKIEAELMDSSSPQVDISYVDGYSVPITCSCNNVAVTGCNKDLWKYSSCPDMMPGPICHNPQQGETMGPVAMAFFAPCQGAAYTYPTDDGALNSSPCSDNVIDCCVGESCPAPERQH